MSSDTVVKKDEAEEWPSDAEYFKDKYGQSYDDLKPCDDTELMRLWSF